MKRFLTFVAGVLIAAPLWAQTPAAPAAGTTNVEVDPIRCWWRTSTGAIRTGEPFDLTLTCAVLENEGVQVIPDESRLGTNLRAGLIGTLGGLGDATVAAEARRYVGQLKDDPTAIPPTIRNPKSGNIGRISEKSGSSVRSTPTSLSRYFAHSNAPLGVK